MKAIETRYKGTMFRSRLEARWAMFFDKIGFNYIYEPEGYVLADGTKYLPDFWLPDLKIAVEVKGPLAQFVSDINRVGQFISWPVSGILGVLILTDIPEAKSANDSSVFWYPYIYFDTLKRNVRFTRVPIIENKGSVDINFNLPMSDWYDRSLDQELKGMEYNKLMCIPDSRIVGAAPGHHKTIEYPLRYSELSTPILDAAYKKAKDFRFDPKKYG